MRLHPQCHSTPATTKYDVPQYKNVRLEMMRGRAQMAALANSTVRFHTNDEDKDDDTHVTVTINDDNNVVAARIYNDFGHFDDHSDAGPLA